MCQALQGQVGVAASSTNGRVSRYFDDPKNYLDPRRYIIDVRRACVKDFVKGRDLHQMLDIGCGDGSISIPLLNERNRLTLIDISPNMLDRAMSRVSDSLQANVETIHRDFLEVPLKPSAYNLILCIGVLAHVGSPEAVIMKAASLLRPGGFLILECTDAENFTNMLTMAVGRVRKLFGQDNGYRTRLNSANSIIRMANGQGLRLVSTYRYNVALPLMSKFLSQAMLRKIIFSIYGSPTKNRNASLGKECLFLFQEV